VQRWVVPVNVRLVVVLPVVPVALELAVVSPVAPVVAAVSPVAPVEAAVARVDPVVVAAPRAPSAAVVDVRFADASPSAPSVRSSSRCRLRRSAVSRFPVATAKLSSGCAVVRR